MCVDEKARGEKRANRLKDVARTQMSCDLETGHVSGKCEEDEVLRMCSTSRTGITNNVYIQTHTHTGHRAPGICVTQSPSKQLNNIFIYKVFLLSMRTGQMEV